MNIGLGFCIFLNYFFLAVFNELCVTHWQQRRQPGSSARNCRALIAAWGGVGGWGWRTENSVLWGEAACGYSPVKRAMAAWAEKELQLQINSCYKNKEWTLVHSWAVPIGKHWLPYCCPNANTHTHTHTHRARECEEVDHPSLVQPPTQDRPFWASLRGDFI
jgi:hypothetical protein